MAACRSEQACRRLFGGTSGDKFQVPTYCGTVVIRQWGSRKTLCQCRRLFGSGLSSYKTSL